MYYVGYIKNYASRSKKRQPNRRLLALMKKMVESPRALSPNYNFNVKHSLIDILFYAMTISMEPN